MELFSIRIQRTFQLVSTFDNEVDDYRTDNENEVFKIFHRISASYREDKTKATTDFHQLSLSVGMRRLERPTPTSRT